ncbi:hypothetical protein HYC85_016596 [Camellia sinensis]|uniref:C2 domain-containing protein n=1 Tax=Camellia sinensis TaxID=4442 RepID=A0A7J7H3S5_CAMSI|nr:hypothetical protein HYC85_016596 [Camellia sinensis]
MGLISGIFMGTIFGIALMAGWRHMMRYRSNKRIAKAVDIKLLGSLSRDDLKKICGDNFPDWISFPVFEQDIYVKFLNFSARHDQEVTGMSFVMHGKILTIGDLVRRRFNSSKTNFIKCHQPSVNLVNEMLHYWSIQDKAATMVIKESVEPLLEEYRPPGITSLKFNKFSLGNVAPKIEGIRVQSLKKGQITMDIDFRWGGNPNIVLGVEAAMVASIPIQVGALTLKDLQVFTVVRVIFQLAEDIPCISAVVVALLSEPKPKIDYTVKAVGGSLTALPGISDMIDDTVNTIVTDMLQWPHRIVVPIGGIPVDTSELELKPQGKLTVTVVKANDLKNMEMIGKSDPYVVVYIRPLFKVKSKVVENNLNPIWNQTFGLIAEDKETQSLILEVLYHQFSKEDQLAALEEEKRILEERKKLKEAGVIGSTMDALDGAASLVGSGVGMVGTGIGAGVGLVGTGIGAGVGIVGSGFGAVGSGLSKAGKFMGRTITGHHSSSSRRSWQHNSSEFCSRKWRRKATVRVVVQLMNYVN